MLRGYIYAPSACISKFKQRTTHHTPLIHIKVVFKKNYLKKTKNFNFNPNSLIIFRVFFSFIVLYLKPKHTLSNKSAIFKILGVLKEVLFYSHGLIGLHVCCERLKYVSLYKLKKNKIKIIEVCREVGVSLSSPFRFRFCNLHTKSSLLPKIIIYSITIRYDIVFPVSIINLLSMDDVFTPTKLFVNFIFYE
jgi:hypothetical protein